MKTCVERSEILNKHGTIINSKSFAELYEKYYQQLFLFAAKHLGSTEEAADVVQDCFIKLWQLKEKTQRIKYVRNYLYTMVRNRCIDLIHSKNRSLKVEQEWQQYLTEPSTVTNTPDPEKDTLQEINSAIKKLPPRMQEVFNLCYLEGKSCTEIGTLLNTTSGTVRNQRYTALCKLKKMISQN